MRRGLAWLAGLAVLLAVVVPALALLQPDRLEVERSIDIDAPATEAIPFVEDFTQWVKWSPWEHVDPNLKRLFGNPFRGMGASYTWSGNDAVGEARLKIRTARLPLGVFIDAGFQRPQRIDGRMAFKFDPLPTGARLTWSLSGPLSFGQRLAAVFESPDARFAPAFETGLANLKRVVEEEHRRRAPAQPATQPTTQTDTQTDTRSNTRPAAQPAT